LVHGRDPKEITLAIQTPVQTKIIERRRRAIVSGE
jgi:hypothetical protein